jgi:DNA-binding response OmpR family regulator
VSRIASESGWRRSSVAGGRLLVLAQDGERRERLLGALGRQWDTEVAGEATIEVVRQLCPDVVVMDALAGQRPVDRLDVLDLLRQVRADPSTSGTAVVLLAPGPAPELVVEALNAGAADVLAENLKPEELVARVRAYMALVRRQDELAERAALLQAQIDSAPQAVLAVSPDRRVLACNRRFEKLWNLPGGSVVVGSASPALLAGSLEQVVDPKAFEQALRWGHQNPDVNQELDVPLTDGRVIQGMSSPIRTEDGTYRGRIWFMNDDTERRSTEAFREELLGRLQAAQRSQAFLLSAAQVLARTTGYEETLRSLAAVAVPTLGDICLIDVVDEGQGLRRLASRHVDPARQSLVDLLASFYPPDPQGLHPSAEVLRTGSSIWSETMSEEFLRRTSRNEEHYQLTKQLGFCSFMTVPLSDRGEVLGAITLISSSPERRFGPQDLSLAEALAGQVAAVVGKARRYEEEHVAAHTLQSSLLPSALPTVTGLSVAVRYLPGSRGAEVGGDWYDVVPHPSGSIVLAVGDVAGHDIGAAAAMGAVRSGLRALIRHAEDPSSLVELLQFSWDDLGVDRIATLVVVFIDPATGSFTVASAGHPPPLLVGPDGATEFLAVSPTAPLGGPPLEVEHLSGRLEEGQLMLLYSDGLIETREATLTEGMQHLSRLAAGAGTEPESFCTAVLSGLARVRSDDVALLAACVPGRRER